MNNDFIIENGVLKKYTGHDSNVVIPENVNYIGSCAFGAPRTDFGWITFNFHKNQKNHKN